ncbi:MAG: hypothetical protein HOP07_18000 [Bacteriovoracaceae bacterium]|nr:hypothetical protein [Bacteriovoracaceae bacterium]
MKKLLILMLTGFLNNANSSELDGISLIMPINYKQESTFGHYLTSKLTAKAASVFRVDIEKKVYARVEPRKKDLASYFPLKGELDSFVSTIVKEGIRAHLTDVTDENLTSFYKFLGNNLIAKFADRILEKEGVADPARRRLWVNKLVQPFNGCMTGAMNFQFDANHCLDALISSLVPSTGIGIVYELSKANLTPALPEMERSPFNKAQTDLYKTCLPKNKESTGADVKSCALSSMKSGVLKVTEDSLTKIINSKASSSQQGKNIKIAVWPTFEECNKKVGSDVNSKISYTDQFTNCIDNLIGSTGTFLVQDKIENTPAINEKLSPQEVKKLASEKGKQFKICADGQKAKGERLNGLLNIESCKRIITNEVTLKVVGQILTETAQKSIKSDKALSNKTSNEGLQLLNSCWSNQQSNLARESCLKKTIISFSQKIATIKLAEAIPDSMPKKNELSVVSVASFSKCVEKSLPSNISESTDLTQRIDSCTGKLTRAVALQVADYQIRSTAKGNLSEAQTSVLIKKMVNEKFANCIGEMPTDSSLEKCSNILSIEAALEITEISFSKEVMAYLEKAGGLNKLKLSKSDVDNFLTSLNKSNKACIEAPLSAPVMNQVNSCIKKSIKSIAFFFGETQLNNSLGTMYSERLAEKALIENRFKKSLGECLASKDSAEFSISDFTKNLYVCSDKIANSTTIEVGTDQVNTALAKYLKDRPGLDLSKKRVELGGLLVGNFQACMSKSLVTNECIDELLRSATKNIVHNYGRAKAKIQLSTDEYPPTLKTVEDTFTKCTEAKLAGDQLSAHLDNCLKKYALSFANNLGELKMNYLMLQTLGTEEYNQQKKNIDNAIALYKTCLKNLEDVNMNDGLTTKLTVCTDNLTSRGMSIVRSSIAGWMTTDQKDAATTLLKQDFSNLLPCVSVLFPSSPYTPQLAANIDSSVKVLAKLLSQYIEYNPDNAKQTLAGVIETLATDFNDVAKTTQAKKDLLDFLYQSGGLDQLLKAIVRGTVKDSFATISEKDVPMDIRAALLKRENFEEIFNSKEGSKIKDLVMSKVLKPILIDNVDTKNVAYRASLKAIKDSVIQVLVDAPSFGEKVIILGIQKQISEMSGVKKFFAKALYGENALDWEKVRTSADGKKAEMYLKEKVLIPKFKGTTIDEIEQQRIYTEAENLVTNAVKSFRKKS